jgi:hypothetical protein
LRRPDKIVGRSAFASGVSGARLVASPASEFIPRGTEMLFRSGPGRWPGQTVVNAVVPTRRPGHQRLFQRDGSVPGGEVIEIGHVDLEILVDEFVAEGNSERLQPGTNLVIRANSIGPDEEDEVRYHRGPVGRL